jgi:peroxiredoxin Q/BCP
MTQLKPGDKAPTFKGVDQNGNPVSLAGYKGKRLILFFYPQDNSQTCTVEACNLRDNYNLLKDKGFELLGVSPDSAVRHKNFIKKYDLPFPLLVDTERKVIEAYGLWGWKKTFGIEHQGVYRTTFVIDKKGVIEHIFDKVESKRHAEQVLEAWASVKRKGA